MLLLIATWLAGALVLGSWVYCVLTVVAAYRYTGVRPPPLVSAMPLSVLKPLAGEDEGLEENLRSFFRQDYPDYELVFAVRSARDPAVAVVERLRSEYPERPSRLLITGDPPYANAKVFALDRMLGEARHEVLVMSDSDIRVGPDMLRRVAAEFQEGGADLATCPYRAVPGRPLWSVLEAIGMNTEFLGGILVARMLEGMHFAVGPTIVARRGVLEKIGGFDRLKDYLAEDFVMGKFAAEAGFRVILSSYAIEHRIGGGSLGENIRHRLRWARSTRRSRPAGYVGQLFTNPLPPALLLTGLAPGWWPALAVTVVARAAAAWVCAGKILDDPLCRSKWYLIAVQDLASFGFWAAGFFGNVIEWRGRRYRLRRDGRFELESDLDVVVDGGRR